MKKVYMAVSNDKYELPFMIEDKLTVLAQKLKVSYNTCRTYLAVRNGVFTNEGFKIVKVVF